MAARPEQWDESELPDLQRMFYLLWRRRWMVLACMIVLGLAGLALAFIMKPVYRAAVVLMPVSSERGGLNASLGSAIGSLGGLASLAGINVGTGDDATQESLAVLTSREMTERFITDKNLLPALFPRRWDAAAGKWKVPPEDQPTLAEAYKYFDNKVRAVNWDRKTGLVTLRIDWRDRNEAAAWANELAARLNAEMRGRAISQAEASLGFLDKELAGTNQLETRQSLSRLIETQIRQRMLANVNPDYVFRVVDKAMPPDADDPERPIKWQFALAGAMLGLFIGVIATLIMGTPRVKGAV